MDQKSAVYFIRVFKTFSRVGMYDIGLNGGQSCHDELMTPAHKSTPEHEDLPSTSADLWLLAGPL